MARAPCRVDANNARIIPPSLESYVYAGSVNQMSKCKNSEEKVCRTSRARQEAGTADVGCTRRKRTDCIPKKIMVLGSCA